MVLSRDKREADSPECVDAAADGAVMEVANGLKGLHPR